MLGSTKGIVPVTYINSGRRRLRRSAATFSTSCAAEEASVAIRPLQGLPRRGGRVHQLPRAGQGPPDRSSRPRPRRAGRIPRPGPGARVQDLRHRDREALGARSSSCLAMVRHRGCAPSRCPTASLAHRTVLDRFAALARSLEGHALSVDATGGFDPAHRLPPRRPRPAVRARHLRPAGDRRRRDRTDDRPSPRAPVPPHGPRSGDLDAELVLTFRAGDGITDLRRFHRDWQHARARFARGIRSWPTVEAASSTRPLRRLPVYGSGASTSSVTTWIAPAGLPPGALTPVGRELLAAARILGPGAAPGMPGADEQGNLRPHLLPVTVAGALRAALHELCEHGPGCRGAPARLPFCGLAAIGLPPWSRFFYGWHRRVITARCPGWRCCRRPTAFPPPASPRECSATLGGTGRPSCVGPRRGERGPCPARPGLQRRSVRGGRGGLHGTATRSPHYAAGLERLEATGILTTSHAGEKPRHPRRPRPHARHVPQWRRWLRLPVAGSGSAGRTLEALGPPRRRPACEAVCADATAPLGPGPRHSGF